MRLRFSRRMLLGAAAAVGSLATLNAIYSDMSILGKLRLDYATSVPAPMQRVLVIVAHQDDDLLFMNPDVRADIRAGHNVRTVYVTAGDNRSPMSYWHGREQGMKRAYAEMAGVRNHWDSTTLSVYGRQLSLVTLTDAPHVSLVFMRLPDNADGKDGRVTLKELWKDSGGLVVVSSVDGSASYTRLVLIQTLAALLFDYRPHIVRTQDPSARDASGKLTPPDDHPDHIRVARFVRAAEAQYSVPHVLTHYLCNRSFFKPVNLSAQDIHWKTMIFETYVLNYDALVCYPHGGISCFTDPTDASYNQNVYRAWLSRKYSSPILPG